MHDLFISLTNIDDYETIVVAGAVVCALWLLKTMTESTALTIFFAPGVLLGALAANYLFRVNFVTASNDKDTNVLIASATGVLLAVLLMLLATRITIIMSDRNDRTAPVALDPLSDPMTGRK